MASSMTSFFMAMGSPVALALVTRGCSAGWTRLPVASIRGLIVSEIASGRRRLAGRSQISADFASGYGDAPTVLSTPSSLSTIWLEHPKWRRLARKTAINAIVLLSKSVSRARERATRGRLASHVGHRTGDAANQDWRPDLHRWIVSPGQTFQRTPNFSQDPMSAH